MKILMVIDTLMCGGAQKMFTYLANNLDERGYEIFICCYASNEVYFAINENIKLHCGTQYEGGHYTRHIKKIAFVERDINVFDPELIICFAPIPAIIANFAKKNKDIPVVYCERGDPYQWHGIGDYFSQKLVSRCDYFVFQTEGAKNFFSEKIKKKAYVIPNPVTYPKGSVIDKGDRRNIISFVARFEVKQKRQDLMLQAFKKVVERFPNYTLHFYGDGDDIESIKSMALELSIQNNVVFEGNVSSVKQHIADSKLFVLCSDYEGIPNALIEAMSLGIPCISTKCSPGGAELLIENGVNGLLVPCNDVDALAQAICSLLEDSQFAQTLGVNAQSVCDRFSPEKILNLWEVMIREVTQK